MLLAPVRLRLRLLSHAENVAVVRAALSGLATAAGLTGEQAVDVKTAASEACNNVCLHAYPAGDVGPMLLDCECRSDGLSVGVIDQGRGITRISNRNDRMGLGLALINALADSTEFRRASGGGAEVHMHFAWPLGIAPGPSAPETADAALTGADAEAPVELTGDVVLWCRPAQVQRHVLLRLLTLLAASAHFSVSSLEHLAEVNAGIAREVERAAGDWIGASIDPEPRLLHLTIAPLEAPDDVPRRWGESSLEATADSLAREPLDGHSAVRLTIADRGH